MYGTLTGKARYAVVSHYSTYNGSPTQYITNNYWLTGCGASYGARKGNSNTNTGAVPVASNLLKTYNTILRKRI
ncbi:MAG: hypothetical protein HFJ50_06870 [Clostridia bacterium]|jgi:hypothetical protein|nr:hypothetical protein [Clostridia bacterium]